MKDDKFLWWKNGIVYQIYPRSFCDSNGDGIGDIPGIISKIDYLAHLGVNAVWLSPIFQSPLEDMGYDVSDYRVLDPDFGDENDFKKLVKSLHLRGIKLILDIPLNHTSDQHPWFVASASSEDNPKRDWYIWHPGKGKKDKEGKRDYPNNWRGAFGGRAWTWDPTTEHYYLHSFLKEQPDLNWRNPEVKKAIFKDMTYWLELGVDGFRLDVANCIVKDAELKDNSYINFSGYPRIYDLQIHANDRNQPESHEIYKELRKLLDKYDAMAVGEILPNEGRREPELSASYLGGEEADELHLAFNFSTMDVSFDPKDFLKILTEWYAAVPEKGWPCHVLSNHDRSRAFTRIAGGSVEKAKVLAALLLTQKGTPFIYYGDEIGMCDGKLSKQQIFDRVGKLYWPFYKGRDPFRTPMQWDRSKYAGFSENTPWLPVNENSRQVNVYRQDEQQSSLLSFYRRLISLRRSEEALYNGDWQPVEAGKEILAYYRTGEKDKFFIALSFSSGNVRLKVDESSSFEISFSTHRQRDARLSIKDVVMYPYEVLIAKKIN